MDLKLLALSVGKPQIIGTLDGAPVLSGIAKSLVTADTVFVGATNIDGDGQADLRVHGGVDKAIYAYPAEHWPWWEREKSFPCRPNSFGENLTLEGSDESGVAIGDRFRWGDVLLEISQPRAPCYKFAIHSGRADAPQIMTVSARCGWYFRVIDEGTAPVHGARLHRVSQSGGPSVREAFVAALHPGASRDVLTRIHDARGLSQAWREAIGRRLAP